MSINLNLNKYLNRLIGGYGTGIIMKMVRLSSVTTAVQRIKCILGEDQCFSFFLYIYMVLAVLLVPVSYIVIVGWWRIAMEELSCPFFDSQSSGESVSLGDFTEYTTVGVTEPTVDV